MALEGYQRVPGSARNYIDKSTGEVISYRQYLNAEKQSQGFKSQYDYEKKVEQTKRTGNYLGDRFEKYAAKQQKEGEPVNRADFLRKYAKHKKDRKKIKGGDYWEFIELYADEDEDAYLERSMSGIRTFS